MECLHQTFISNEYMHGHITRRHGDIHIIRCNTNHRAFSVKIYGAKIWNSIPMSIRFAPSINIFKMQIEVVPFLILYLKVLSVSFFLPISVPCLIFYLFFSSDLFLILIFFPMQMLSCIIFLLFP